MKKILIAVAVLIVLGIGAFFIFGDNYGKMMKEYGSLVEPRVTEMADAKVLEYKGTGDPNTVAMTAFKSIFNTYFSLKGVSKMNMPAPKARWTAVEITKKDEWVGLYAIDVPESITELPAGSDANVKLAIWKYGKVAEILHIGPWSEETPTIEKLKKFIADSGLVIAADHEEDYIKGPGMFGKGNPKKYLTIIRYQVKEKASNKQQATGNKKKQK